MRLWISTMTEVDSGQVDENGDPIMVQKPNGLDIESPWAAWPVVDDDDAVQVTTGGGNPIFVFLARDLDAPPSAGRDAGDPTPVYELQPTGELDPYDGTPLMQRVVVSPYHTVPLGINATRTIESWIGMEEDELKGSTRAEAIRAITQDEGAAIGCTWGPEKVGAECWPARTRRVRRFRRRQDRAWFNSLTLPQRRFIRNLTDEQKDTLRDTPIPDRAALLQSWNT